MTRESKRRVVVLGASTNPHRYSNMAVKKLLLHGYDVVPVHPTYTSVESLPVVKSVADVSGEIDTVTVYVSDAHRDQYLQDVLAQRPRRVIFNPGAESEIAMRSFADVGIIVEEACTLVLLSINQF